MVTDELPTAEQLAREKLTKAWADILQPDEGHPNYTEAASKLKLAEEELKKEKVAQALEYIVQGQDAAKMARWVQKNRWVAFIVFGFVCAYFVWALTTLFSLEYNSCCPCKSENATVGTSATTSAVTPTITAAATVSSTLAATAAVPAGVATPAPVGTSTTVAAISTQTPAPTSMPGSTSLAQVMFVLAVVRRGGYIELPELIPIQALTPTVTVTPTITPTPCQAVIPISIAWVFEYVVPCCESQAGITSHQERGVDPRVFLWGFLGGVVWCMYGLTNSYSRRRFDGHYVFWYVLNPWIAGALGAVFVMTILGGVFANDLVNNATGGPSVLYLMSFLAGLSTYPFLKTLIRFITKIFGLLAPT